MEASKDPQPWKDYISSDPLFQELARLKEEVRNSTLTLRGFGNIV
jgi:hypothetical protein